MDVINRDTMIYLYVNVNMITLIVLKISKKDYLQHLGFRIIVLMFLNLNLSKCLKLQTVDLI
jgi:hypothetical protein